MGLSYRKITRVYYRRDCYETNTDKFYGAYSFPRGALIVIHKCHEARHSGRDCRNPGYMDVFELAIHGTGYPLPGGYDEFLNIFVYNNERGAWEPGISF
jgi:hypothetical protein